MQARQEVWGQSCFLLDPDGNGVEVQQLTSNSSCSSIGRGEKARRREAALNTWHSYMAEQEADISRQQKKQQLMLQLSEIETQIRERRQQQQEREDLVLQQQEIQRQLAAFEEQQRVLDELEQQQQQRQREEEAAAAGAALQHKGPLTPRIQKVGRL